ncbi:MAG: Ig-like domain-containing protein [Bacteroidaceae bacterium]|nr:Ig-like domain-containing protein [Bacteroidaceae bacterium]
MKKIYVFLLAALTALTIDAQVINGDLNHNMSLDVDDVTRLISSYLTGEVEVVPTSASRIVGTWVSLDGAKLVRFYANGAVEGFGTDCKSYQFVSSDKLQFQDAAGTPVATYSVVCVTEICLAIRIGKAVEIFRPYGETISSISLSKTSLSLEPGVTAQLTVTVKPAGADIPELAWTSSNGQVATVTSDGLVKAVSDGTCIIVCQTTDGSHLADTCRVTVKALSGWNRGHEWVDLGLSVNWATMNVGGTISNPAGSYFAWGERAAKSTYTWENYKHSNGSDTTLIKYNTRSEYGNVDGKTTLEPADDAACWIWAGIWRMPTNAEWEELRTKCTWKRTTQDGVYGFSVTSKINGKSIFLPTTGYYRNDTHTFTEGEDGSCNYWSSSLSTDRDKYAYYQYARLSTVARYTADRYLGMPVRPVLPRTYVPVTSITLNQSSIVLDPRDGRGLQLTATVEPANASNPNVVWTSSDDDEEVVEVRSDGTVYAVGKSTAIITAEAADGSGVKATCEVTVKNLFGISNNQAWVDLGLSVRWALMNVGATSDSDYGDYFAWGETKPKSTYNWSTYKWGTSEDNLTKYNLADGKKQLDLADDAARANWGGSWRMPTEDEFYELVHECDWEWTTKGGVNGYEVTSRTTRQSIFLPAAGFRSDSTLGFPGTYGYYSSSSILVLVSNKERKYSQNLFFSSKYSSLEYLVRSIGQSVRAVLP